MDTDCTQVGTTSSSFPRLPEGIAAYARRADAACAAAAFLRTFFGFPDSTPSSSRRHPTPPVVHDHTLATMLGFTGAVADRDGPFCAISFPSDRSFALLRVGADGVWCAWPSPLVPRFAATPGFVMRRAEAFGMHPLFDARSPFARNWNDVAQGLPVPYWWPLSKGWAHAPMPIWAKDRKALEAAFAAVAWRACALHAVKPTRAHLTIGGAWIDEDDLLHPGDVHAVGGSSLRAVGLRLIDGISALRDCLLDSVPTIWMLDRHVSHDPQGAPRLTTGTLFSVEMDAARSPDSISAHAFLAARALLPACVVDALERPQP